MSRVAALVVNQDGYVVGAASGPGGLDVDTSGEYKVDTVSFFSADVVQHQRSAPTSAVLTITST